MLHRNTRNRDREGSDDDDDRHQTDRPTNDRSQRNAQKNLVHTTQDQLDIKQSDDRIEHRHETALLVDSIKDAWFRLGFPFPSVGTFLAHLRVTRAGNGQEKDDSDVSDELNQTQIDKILRMNNIIEVKPPELSTNEIQNLDQSRQESAKKVLDLLKKCDEKSDPIYFFGHCPLAQLKSFLPSWNDIPDGLRYYPSLLLLVASNCEVIHHEIVDNGATLLPSQIIDFLTEASDEIGDGKIHNVCCNLNDSRAFTHTFNGSAGPKQTVMQSEWKHTICPPGVNSNLTVAFFSSLKIFIRSNFVPLHEKLDLTTWTEICGEYIETWISDPVLTEEDVVERTTVFLEDLAKGNIKVEAHPIYAYHDGLSIEILRSLAWE